MNPTGKPGKGDGSCGSSLGSVKRSVDGCGNFCWATTTHKSSTPFQKTTQPPAVVTFTNVTRMMEVRKTPGVSEYYVCDKLILLPGKCLSLQENFLISPSTCRKESESCWIIVNLVPNKARIRSGRTRNPVKCLLSQKVFPKFIGRIDTNLSIILSFHGGVSTGDQFWVEILFLKGRSQGHCENLWKLGFVKLP